MSLAVSALMAQKESMSVIASRGKFPLLLGRYSSIRNQKISRTHRQPLEGSYQNSVRLSFAANTSSVSDTVVPGILISWKFPATRADGISKSAPITFYEFKIVARKRQAATSGPRAARVREIEPMRYGPSCYGTKECNGPCAELVLYTKYGILVHTSTSTLRVGRLELNLSRSTAGLSPSLS